MQRFDIEQQAPTQQQQQLPPPPLPSGEPRERFARTRKLIGSVGQDGAVGPLISLRKYSAAICLVEALAIVLLIYLLLKLPAPHQPEHSGRYSIQGLVSDASAPYRTYSDHLSSARLLLGLAPNCTQRRHDLGHSVLCHSHRAPGECAPVESQRPGLAVGGGAVPVPGGQTVEVIETSRQGARLERRRESLTKRALCSAPAGSGPDGPCSRAHTQMVVRLSQRHQRIIGWGGALTDSSLNNVLSLTTNATRNLLDDYFGPDGLRFNLVRVTIGGSDFSSRFYTNDDLAGRELSNGTASGTDADWSLSKFQLMDEDTLYKIPMLRFIRDQYFAPARLSRASPARDLKILASMWSPPVWMKDNRHFNKGHLRGSIGDEPLGPADDAREPGGGNAGGGPAGPLPNPEAAYAALAKLKVKWLEAYSAAGVDLWGLTVMNEPVFAVQPFLNFNTMIFPRDDYANYVAKYLGPQVRRRPRLAHLKLMVHDDNRRFLRDFTRPMLEQTRVRKFVDGISVHGYIDEDYEQMAELYDQFQAHGAEGSPHGDQDFFVLPTELCSGHLPFMEKALAGNWHRGVHYALDIIRSLQAQAAGWVDWNMVLDLEGGPGWLGGRLDAPVLVDKARDLYHRSPMFYVLGHFSRYIPPGSVRLGLELQNAKYDAHLETVAFETPEGKLALVVVNNNPYPVTLHWRLDSSRGPAATQVGAREFYVTTSPAESVQTIVYQLPAA